jgi:hypothetical protein
VTFTVAAALSPRLRALLRRRTCRDARQCGLAHWAARGGRRAVGQRRQRAFLATSAGVRAPLSAP